MCLKQGFSLSIVLFAFSIVSCTSHIEPIEIQVNEFEIEDNAIVQRNRGIQNAIKKAAQMKNIRWSPTAEGMPWNNGEFQVGTTYSGIPYSSVLEYCKYVFLDVSVETFLTAVHNPRSVVYTENVSAENSKSVLGREYNGNNCACYYGSTCSYLIIYALGLPYGILAAEFPYYEDMEVVDEQSHLGVELADVLSSGRHVVLVTGIKRDNKGKIQSITVTENAWRTTSSSVYTPEQFDNYLSTGYTILRYKYFERNTNYNPLTYFVAIEGETLDHYSYNDDVCPNYGNKSNYNEGDIVIINIGQDYESKGFTQLLLYKNNQLVNIYTINDIDIVLSELAYGDYKVCLRKSSGQTSEFAYFKVVNMSVKIDSNGPEDVVYFASKNATPIYYDICNKLGHKGPKGANAVLSHLFTSDELSAGKTKLNSPLVLTEDYPYIKVHFENEFGRTIITAKKSFL